MNYAFFGSAQFSIYVLDELEKAGFLPKLVVTTPDKPVGRGLIMTANPVKKWAIERHLDFLDCAKLDHDFIKKIKEKKCDLFIVAAYGKIIPQSVLDIPKHKILNVHPSLLPKYRGASPLQSAMLDDTKKTGVTIIRIDELMDHGPIIAQKEIVIDEWPIYEIFEEKMAREGGRLLAKILPDWIANNEHDNDHGHIHIRIPEIPQNHAKATFTKKIAKTDAEINFADDPYLNFRKIQAYHLWPTAYFFASKNNADNKKIRVKITRAIWEKNKTDANGALIIEKVIPEGKSETEAKPYLPH